MKLGDRIKRLEQRKGDLPLYDAKQRLAVLLNEIAARLATGKGGALDYATPEADGPEGRVTEAPRTATSILGELRTRDPA